MPLAGLPPPVLPDARLPALNMRRLLTSPWVTSLALMARAVAEEGNWDSRFFLPGVHGEVRAVATSGTDLFAGGRFASADDIAASNIARWTGSRWTALGDGVNGDVLALAAYGANVYAGGEFTSAGGINAGRVARWDGSTWSGLGSGIEGARVNALAVDARGLVYAGGEFTNAGGVATLNIARWDGLRWSALGGGLGNGIYPAWVLALATHGEDVYAGGFFSDAGGVTANCIARWNGTSWSNLGSGVDDRDYLPQVTALTFLGEDLYAGGAFTLAGNGAANHVARWDGLTWSALGGGLSRFFGDIPVTTLAANGSDLLVGGRFDMADGVPATNLARWDGNAWSEISGGVEGAIHAIHIHDAQVHVAGSFHVSDGSRELGLARRAESEWRNVTSGGGLGFYGPRTCAIECFGDQVSALVGTGSVLYAAGSFVIAGQTVASNVARWDGTRWQALGLGVNGPVHCLALHESGLFASGEFLLAGGMPASNVAFWNGATWSPLGTGLVGPVRALALMGNRLYAGGDFTSAGGVSVSRVACWDGASWSALESGINGSVHALAVSSRDELFAGGKFTRAGSALATNMAVWNGAAWSALKGGVYGVPNPAVRLRPPPVSAMVFRDNQLFVGGDFAYAGGVPATNVARWNGADWAALGVGLPSSLGLTPPPAVAALEFHEGTLYAGGSFNRVGELPAHGLARWDGFRWEPFSEGVERGLFSAPWVGSLAMDDSSLYVGGHFKFVGSRPASDFVIWHLAPRLRIDRTEIGAIRLSWPASVSSYTLQTKDGLDDGAWMTIEGDWPVEGNQRVMMDLPSVPQRFYRLNRLEPSGSP